MHWVICSQTGTKPEPSGEVGAQGWKESSWGAGDWALLLALPGPGTRPPRSVSR